MEEGAGEAGCVRCFVRREDSVMLRRRNAGSEVEVLCLNEGHALQSQREKQSDPSPGRRRHTGELDGSLHCDFKRVWRQPMNVTVHYCECNVINDVPEH